MAQANIDEPPDLAPPTSDIETAELHGNHIANVTRQYKEGRKKLPAEYDTFLGEVDVEGKKPLGLKDLMK